MSFLNYLRATLRVAGARRVLKNWLLMGWPAYFGLCISWFIVLVQGKTDWGSFFHYAWRGVAMVLGCIGLGALLGEYVKYRILRRVHHGRRKEPQDATYH